MGWSLSAHQPKALGIANFDANRPCDEACLPKAFCHPMAKKSHSESDGIHSDDILFEGLFGADVLGYSVSDHGAIIQATSKLQEEMVLLWPYALM
jgi:hypothetical protein